MLPDPPHKRGYHTTVPTGYSFVRWNELNNYTHQARQMHESWKESEDIERKRRYKEELDMMVNLKRMKEKKDKRNEQFAHHNFVKDLDYFDAHEAEQNLKASMFQKEMLAESEKQRDTLRQQQQEYKRLDNARHNDNLRRNKELEQMERLRTENIKQSNAQEFANNYNESVRRKKEEKAREAHIDKKCSEAERQLIAKLEAENRAFFDRIRNVGKYNQPAIELYQKLYADAEEKNKAFDFYTIDKPYYERLKKELEAEVRALEQRREMQRDNGEFILRQLDNARLKKQALQYEEQQQEYLALQKQLEQQDLKDQAFTEQYKQRLGANLETLKAQIEENKSKLFFDDFMNENEAKINQTAVTKLNYAGNNSDNLCGTPGMGLVHERKHQVKTMENNMTMDEKHLSEKLRQGSEQFEENLVPLSTTKRLANYDFAKNGSNVLAKENVSMRPQGFSNEYEYIRHKNVVKPFNIISNQFVPR